MGQMRIALIGLGSIGSFLAKSFPEHNFTAFDADLPKAKQTIERMGLANVELVESMQSPKLSQASLAIECASQEAVPLLLHFLKHASIMIMSVGALTDARLAEKLESEAKKHGHRIFIPSGAVGGLDVLQACEPQEVVLETRKSPESLGRKDAKETMVFEGPAREACAKFPKNVNVAATLSLAGIGFDRTRVRIISDPECKTNRHTVRIKGKAGNYTLAFENFPFAENPKTSALAAYSAVSIIKRMDSTTQIG
ncbi:TPA: aspartate dehydrogenase [Candidatus Micrarchaeota archaeon]|nr:aspartate dehydrogenase [Candidatus Micrarchaeota archaeon]